MACSRNELMKVCVAKTVKKTITLKNGMEVEIKALKGSTLMHVTSIEAIDQAMLFTIPRGLVEPQLTSRDIKELIDNNLQLATEIYGEIMELSDISVEAIQEEATEAKKK